MGSEYSMTGKPKIALVNEWCKENNRSTFQTTLKLINVLEQLSTQLRRVITNQSAKGFTCV